MWSTGVHKSGFILFIGSSLFHMLSTCKLWSLIAKYSLSAEVMMTSLYSGHVLYLLANNCYQKHTSRGQNKPIYHVICIITITLLWQTLHCLDFIHTIPNILFKKVVMFQIKRSTDLDSLWFQLSLAFKRSIHASPFLIGWIEHVWPFLDSSDTFTYSNYSDVFLTPRAQL